MVMEDGEINASGSRLGAALFYLLYKNAGFQLQVKNSADQFLVLVRVDNASSPNNMTAGSTDVSDYVLKADYLSSSNLSFWAISDDGNGCGQAKIVLPNSTTNCYVAFDSDTFDVAGPCSLASDDRDSQICIEQLRS